MRLHMHCKNHNCHAAALKLAESIQDGKTAKPNLEPVLSLACTIFTDSSHACN